MSISLINHSRGYSLSGVELCVNIVFLGSGMLYGRRHLQLADRPGASQWQRVIGYIEYFPLLGGIVALIEYALFRCGCFNRQSASAPIQNLISQATFSAASAHITPYINMLHSKETEVVPYKGRRCGFSANAPQYDRFFEVIRYAKTGEEFIDKLRVLHPPTELNGKTITWANFNFYYRSALYWAIYWQKLPFIESIIQSEEGAKLLNKSYPVSIGNYSDIPDRHVERLQEYPIHHAVRVADPRYKSPDAAEAIETTTQTATQIVLRLLELNANINQADGAGRTPLQVACALGNAQLAKLLIKEGGAVRFSPLPGQMLQWIGVDSVQSLAQLYHDLDEEMNQEIVDSTPLILDLSKIVLRYLY